MTEKSLGQIAIEAEKAFVDECERAGRENLTTEDVAEAAAQAVRNAVLEEVAQHIEAEGYDGNSIVTDAISVRALKSPR
jgi:hypothetical protein